MVVKIGECDTYVYSNGRKMHLNNCKYIVANDNG